MSRSKAFGFAAASLACTLILAACAPVQDFSPTSLTVDKALQPISPNITALEQAASGRLETPAFVEFYSDDCAICRRIQGPMRELDQTFDGKIKFIYVDIDLPESQPSVRSFDVRGIPTFVLLSRHGDRRQIVPGWPGQDAVAQSLDQLLRQQ